MAIIKIQNQNLVQATPYTILTSNTAAGVTSLTVKNITGFADDQILILGELGNQGSEIVAINATPSGSTISLAVATKFPHSASTPVQVIQYDQVEFSTAATVAGSKTVLATVDLWAYNDTTNYIDDAGSSGYYFGRFKNTATSTFSGYSDPIPVSGYGIYTARSIVDSALSEINKTTSETLSDSFAFSMLDAFQTDVLRELKRWSFMQRFDEIIGSLELYTWKVAMPTDIDDQNTNKSIYNIRIGRNNRLIWIDKAKWDDFLSNMAYTTLSTSVALNDPTITLTDSGDFDETGVIKVLGNTYTYTANDRATGILTLSEVSTTTNTAGEDVFQNPQEGLPQYFTVFGGYVWYLPIAGSPYEDKNIYMDYYAKQTRITQDSDEIVVPDALMASYFLQWKFLKKLNNGSETEGSLGAMEQYLARRQTLKKKEIMNRTYHLRPNYNNFAIQMQSNGGDPRIIRDGNFSGTGF